MSDVIIIPGQLEGTVTPPSSKSQAHRLIICAALARGESTISNLAFSQDIHATLNCMKALGASWTQVDSTTIKVTGIGGKPYTGALPHMDCGESGSTLRFLIPIALAVAGGGVFTGRGRLMQRPQKPYFDMFREKGITYGRQADVLTVTGKLPSGEYALPGDVSSQFFTGLMLALPLVDGKSTLRSTTVLESADYLTMTREAQEVAGVTVTDNGAYHITPMAYQSFAATVEGDWSQAAFWCAAKALGGEVTLQGMNPKSSQGDMRVLEVYEKLSRPGDVELDVSQCPDLVPPIAAIAAVRRGTTRIVNARRLRIKESDRLATVTETLNKMGAQIEEGEDNLTIFGLEELSGGGAVYCCGDHRIAMMAGIAAMRCRQPVALMGADCVNKSYPTFWDDYHGLGGKNNVIIHG